MSDIKLISQITAREAEDVILINIPGQKYTFGSVYPGKRDTEEFIFCRYKDYVKPIHCFITVDESGKLWIENASETSKTYVNREELKEKRILEIGDNFSFGVRKIFGDNIVKGPVFVVYERITNRLNPAISNFPFLERGFTHFSPGDNDLVLSKILSYLTFGSLKVCRLVAPNWNLEATKILEKKGKINLRFDNYIEPMVSTKVFRFLNEVKHLNVRQMNITLPQTIPPYYYVTKGYPDYDFITYNSLKTCPGEPGQKLIQDIKKLAKSGRQFKTLCVKQQIRSSTDFEILQTILQNLGNGLESLKLCILVVSYNVSKEKIQLLELKSLRKFEHVMHTSLINNYRECCENFVKFLVPLIPRSVEELSLSGNLPELYVKELQKRNDYPKLKALLVNRITFSEIPFLVEEMRFPLTKLELTDVPVFARQEEVDDFSELIAKFADTLEYLKVEIDSSEILGMKFIPFKKLQGLSIKYGHKLRVRWEGGRNRVDYCKDFPVLERFDFQPLLHRTGSGRIYPDFITLPFEWENEEDLFNSFFAYDSHSVCETVRFFEIICNYLEKCNDFGRRVIKFREMFPNAGKFPWENDQ